MYLWLTVFLLPANSLITFFLKPVTHLLERKIPFGVLVSQFIWDSILPFGGLFLARLYLLRCLAIPFSLALIPWFGFCSTHFRFSEPCQAARTQLLGLFGTPYVVSALSGVSVYWRGYFFIGLFPSCFYFESFLFLWYFEPFYFFLTFKLCSSV